MPTPETQKLRCPICSRFLVEYTPHPEITLRIPCARCRNDVFLQGYTVRTEPHLRRIERAAVGSG